MAYKIAKMGRKFIFQRSSSKNYAHRMQDKLNSVVSLFHISLFLCVVQDNNKIITDRRANDALLL